MKIRMNGNPPDDKIVVSFTPKFYLAILAGIAIYVWAMIHTIAVSRPVGGMFPPSPDTNAVWWNHMTESPLDATLMIVATMTTLFGGVALVLLPIALLKLRYSDRVSASLKRMSSRTTIHFLKELTSTLSA